MVLASQASCQLTWAPSLGGNSVANSTKFKGVLTKPRLSVCALAAKCVMIDLKIGCGFKATMKTTSIKSRFARKGYLKDLLPLGVNTIPKQ